MKLPAGSWQQMAAGFRCWIWCLAWLPWMAWASFVSRDRRIFPEMCRDSSGTVSIDVSLPACNPWISVAMFEHLPREIGISLQHPTGDLNFRAKSHRLKLEQIASKVYIITLTNRVYGWYKWEMKALFQWCKEIDCTNFRFIPASFFWWCWTKADLSVFFRKWSTIFEIQFQTTGSSLR